MPLEEKTIKYIAFYNDNKFGAKENRNTSLAITNKINYICNVLNRIGYNVEIVSPCWSNNTSGYYKGHLYEVSKKIKLRNFSTFGTNNKFIKKLNHYFSALQLLLYLLFKTKKNEQLIVYHSLALNIPIKIAKLIKNLNIVLEVEEIYSDVWVGKMEKFTELKYIKSFNKFIFASDTLKEKISCINSIVVYGSYQNNCRKTMKNKINDEINIVYAGSIDNTKGGAENAVKCMEYLPQYYRLNILGFGEETEVQNLIDSINRMNAAKGYKSCEFHGTLVGKNYEEFLLNCDIGLNPQFEGEYMDTAFPSKILSYLSHGLIVVSTYIPSIKKSKISKHITFSVDDKPESIANAILSIDITKSMSSQAIVKNLDKEFLRNLELLLSTK